MPTPFRSIFVFTLALLLTAGVCFAQTQTQTFWLDEMNLLLTTCSWNTAQAKTSVGGGELAIGGKTYQRGVGTHAPAEIMLYNPAKTGTFLAEVGVSDEKDSKGPLSFLFFADGQKVWESGEMKLGDAPKAVKIDLTGVTILKIIVDKGADYYGDHANLGDARVERPADANAPAPTLNRPPRTIYDEDGKEISPSDENGREWYVTQRLLKTGMSEEVKAQTLHPAATILPTDRD
nr:NPCBM/NEW2 domain-containing protein [Thermoguttaceae bacterium]